MSDLRSIRTRLGMSQGQIAEILGCTQGNVSAYERGQYPVPPDAAGKLIEHARSRGLELTYDHVYGAATLPAAEDAAGPASAVAAAGQGA